jgi:hypothetical protein
MKKNVIKVCILGMLIFAGTTAFSASESKTAAANQAAATQCNAGDTGICNDVAEGKACKRIDPDYIGDCGGTSEVPVVEN